MPSVALPQDSSNGRSSGSAGRGFSSVDARGVPRRGSADSPEASPRAESPAASSPLAHRYTAAGFSAAEPGPVEHGGCQRQTAMNCAEGDALGVAGKQECDSKAAAAVGSGGNSSAAPVSVPVGRADVSLSQQLRPERSRLDATEEQILAVSFSDALGVSSWPGDACASSPQHQIPHECSAPPGDLRVAVAVPSRAHSACPNDTAARLAPSSSQEGLGGAGEGRDVRNMSLSLDPTGVLADAATPHLGSPDLSNCVPFRPAHGAWQLRFDSACVCFLLLLLPCCVHACCSHALSRPHEPTVIACT